MQAQLYLMNLSFRHSPDTSHEEMEGAIKRLARDFDYIREHGDKVFRHASMYEEELIPGYRIRDLYFPDIEFPLSRDIKVFLRKVIDHSANSDWANEEIIELINAQEQENLCAGREVYGLLGLNSAPYEITEKYVIYNRRDWLTFHRYFLARFPCEADYFLQEAGKCFPAVYFHSRIEDTLIQMEGAWKNFCHSIVRHLTHLNDVFPEYLQNRHNYQRIEALKHFGLRCGIEVTPQGNVDDKPRMTFSFIDENGSEISICCEPHMKLSRSDRQGDSSYYHNRIYFHEGNEVIQGGKILVGHIGRHIDF